MYFKTLILDVDGVIFDSNYFKEQNIKTAALQYCSTEQADAFVSYFTNLNGIPREIKIREFFKDNPNLGENILHCYNMLNESSLSSVTFTEGAKDGISILADSFNLIALSGGAQQEIEELFKINNISHHFKMILGGPTTKTEHLVKLNLNSPVYFIGDSKVDYEAAESIGANFIFMWQYTQFSDWENYFSDKRIITIKNLSELNQLIQKSNIENA